MDTFSKEGNSVNIALESLLKKGLLQNERICSPWEQTFASKKREFATRRSKFASKKNVFAPLGSQLVPLKGKNLLPGRGNKFLPFRVDRFKGTVVQDGKQEVIGGIYLVKTMEKHQVYKWVERRTSELMNKIRSEINLYLYYAVQMPTAH